jgi:hypothetical protein
MLQERHVSKRARLPPGLMDVDIVVSLSERSRCWWVWWRFMGVDGVASVKGN